jgi:hypothetical protein
MFHLVEFGRETAGGGVDDVAILAQLGDRRRFVALGLFRGPPQVAEEDGDADAFAVADDRCVSRRRLLSLCGCGAL